MRLLTKKSLIGDKIIRVYSTDGTNWFSEKTDLERFEKWRREILQESARSLKKSTTFRGQSNAMGSNDSK